MTDARDIIQEEHSNEVPALRGLMYGKKEDGTYAPIKVDANGGI